MQFCEYGPLRMARDATHKLLISRTGQAPHLYVVGPDNDETREISTEPGSPEITLRMSRALDAFFAAEADPARCGPDAFRPATYNFNQAWDAWTVPGAQQSFGPPDATLPPQPD